ncbi:hypothetical protein Cgig2_000650 [Carnegiea gigantea]|uniref:Uncharacterized protein n=1 Tax=Carnegiea gigantea TaxID=171969 RepID=A0A9Q1JN01_9CARY|nr:hypothetical protein Cgig2_000650 [Carnegiea gigantea]
MEVQGKLDEASRWLNAEDQKKDLSSQVAASEHLLQAAEQEVIKLQGQIDILNVTKVMDAAIKASLKKVEPYMNKEDTGHGTGEGTFEVDTTTGGEGGVPWIGQDDVEAQGTDGGCVGRIEIERVAMEVRMRISSMRRLGPYGTDIVNATKEKCRKINS